MFNIPEQYMAPKNGIGHFHCWHFEGHFEGLVELWRVLWGEINGALGSLPANFGIFHCGRGEKKWQSV
jgi:hypothetical protein